MDRPEPRPFRSRVFLFRMLAGIFMLEGVVILVAYIGCAILAEPDKPVAQVCPQLAGKSTELFGVAVATTLALLQGQEPTK